ncbi:VF530 family protein [Verrucomicrobiales bacterium BCK34]|nr:VF530 family protein [Verrucomicrobiales bacterium BCK34]
MSYHFMSSQQSHPNDPLHGLTLKVILETLVARHGWEKLAERIQIRCFMFDPTINSSLKFLRQTPWARQKVENWYVRDLEKYQA